MYLLLYRSKYTFIILIFYFTDLQASKNRGKVKIMSRRTLCRRLKTIFETDMDAVRKKLEKVLYVCMTADIWSSGDRSFMGTTLHYVRYEQF